jgi:hypothetical protein
MSLIASTSFQGASTPSSAINTTGANLIVLVVARAGSSAPTDSKSNTWASAMSSPGPVGQTVDLYYCFTPTVGSGHTFQCADTFSAGAVLAFSNALASPLDQTLIDSAERTPPTAAGSSLTPTQNNEIVIAAFGGYPADGTIGINGGFSTPVAVPGTGGLSYGCAISYLIQTTAASANPTWTDAGGSGDIRILMASFKASAGGSFIPAILPRLLTAQGNL